MRLCASDVFVCVVHLQRIVWTGKMRMDGIVITEWRYPHSVKLEKAGRKPPTGTAATDGVVVMVIGGGLANLLGGRCEPLGAHTHSVCVSVCSRCFWGELVYRF